MSQSRMSPSYRIEYQKLGWVGKKIQKKILDALCMLLLGGLIAGCGDDIADRLQSGKVLAWDGLLGRWAGPVTPTDPSCGSTTEGLLSIGTDGFGFDPFQSTTVIAGKVANDGHLAGTFVRTVASHQPLSISFDAAPADDDTIRGTLVSGRCHWSVTLHRN